MLKKILSILMLTMIATTTIVRAELWLPDSDDSDEGLLINDPVTDTQVTESPMKTVASKAYVDTQIETKQLKIPAANQPNVGAGETVMTYTSTGNGQIGERALYSDISSYDATTDGDKLITASALNATFTNLPTTPTTKLECANQADGCTLWTIVDQTAYGDMLPSGYTRLEYIESTGTQYINTNITGSTNAVIDMQGTVRSDEMVVFMLAPINATAYGNGFGQYKTNISGIPSFDITIRRLYNVSYTSNSMTVNDIMISYSIANNVNLALFGSTATNRRIANAKLYSAKIYNNDTLLRNFIPAKNSSNVVGMYDTVSGSFFTNAATSGPDFTAGPPMD